MLWLQKMIAGSFIAIIKQRHTITAQAINIKQRRYYNHTGYKFGMKQTTTKCIRCFELSKLYRSILHANHGPVKTSSNSPHSHVIIWNFANALSVMFGCGNVLGQLFVHVIHTTFKLKKTWNLSTYPKENFCQFFCILWMRLN